MNNEKLNKKLAEWAGFEYREEYHYGSLRKLWVYPDRTKHPNIPDFTDPELGIAYGFKWLVLKFDGVWWYDFDNGRHTWTFRKQGSETIGEAETPALALCLAIEKLIDKEND